MWHVQLFLISILFSNCGPILKPEELETPYSRLPNESLIPLSTIYCEISPNGQYEEKLTVEQSESDDMYWASGGGCILRPIRETWALTHNLNLMQWEKTHEFSATKLSPAQDLTHHYEIKYIVHDTLTVDWTMVWFHSLTGWGGMEDPGQVSINYQKTKGTSHIRRWEGSILLEAVEDGVTGFSIRNGIKGSSVSGIGAERAKTAVEDVYDKLKKANNRFSSRQEPNWDAIGGK